MSLDPHPIFHSFLQAICKQFCLKCICPQGLQRCQSVETMADQLTGFHLPSYKEAIIYVRRRLSSVRLMWGSPQPCSPHSCSLRNSTNTVGSGRVPSHGRGWLDQLSCHLVPDPALQVSQPSTYSIYELLEELVLHNQIQEHDISTDDKNLNNGCDQRPWQQLSSIYGAPETRDLEPDQ